MPVELWISLTIWSSLMLLAFFVELQTNDFLSLGIMLSSLLAAIVSFWVDDLLIQAIVFVSSSVVMSIFLFKFIKKEIPVAKSFNDSRVVGKTFTITKQDERTKLFTIQDSGIEWFLESTDTLELGSRVHIKKIKGSKLIAKLEKGIN